MRRVTTLLLLCLALPLSAQTRVPPARRFPPDWNNALPQYEKRVQTLSAGIKRDAFIISRVTLAMADLSDDFQKLSSLQKAFDRIEEATLRATQDPVAGPRTLTALSKMTAALEDGRRQGTMADLDALRTTIMTEAQDIRRDLFNELGEARGERQNLIELQNKVQIMNADLEAAMIEALGSTFDYMGAGGK